MLNNNKIFKIFVMLTVFLPLLFLTSCDEPPHEHTWGKWQFNENYHWREFDCCPSAVISREWHSETEESKDGLCDICSAEMSKIKLLDINNLNGKYYGEGCYLTPYSFYTFSGKEFIFNDNKYDSIERVPLDDISEVIDSIDDNIFLSYLKLSLENVNEIENIYYYETAIKKDYSSRIYAFQLDNDIYLLDVTYSNKSEYKILAGYRLIEQREIYTISEAFKSEFLKHEDLEVLAEMNKNNIVSSVKLDSEIELQIIKEFCRKYDLDYEEESGKVRFFGEYNGSYVIMVDGFGMEYAQVETYHTTDGVTFNYSSSQCLLVWKKVK